MSPQYGAQGNIPFDYLGKTPDARDARHLLPRRLQLTSIFATIPSTRGRGFYIGNQLQLAGGPLQGDANGRARAARGAALCAALEEALRLRRARLGRLSLSLRLRQVRRDQLQESGTVPRRGQRARLPDPLLPRLLRRRPGLEPRLSAAWNRSVRRHSVPEPRRSVDRRVGMQSERQGMQPADGRSLALGAERRAPHHRWRARSRRRFSATPPTSRRSASTSGFDRPHLSCGAGARYDTPVGPIRLDIGYRIPGAQFPAGSVVRAAAGRRCSASRSRSRSASERRSDAPCAQRCTRAARSRACGAAALALGGIFVDRGRRRASCSTRILPATRRLVASVANDALSTLFLGRIAIGEVQQLAARPVGPRAGRAGRGLRSRRPPRDPREGRERAHRSREARRARIATLAAPPISRSPTCAHRRGRACSSTSTRTATSGSRARSPAAERAGEDASQPSRRRARTFASPSRARTLAARMGSRQRRAAEARRRRGRRPSAHVVIRDNRLTSRSTQAHTTLRAPRAPGQSADVHGRATGGLTAAARGGGPPRAARADDALGLRRRRRRHPA